MRKILALLLLVTLTLTFPALAQDDANVVSQWATTAEASSEYGDVANSAMQATGAPNTMEFCSDSSAAWASESPNEIATLTVYYGVAVIPTEINIYQNFNPGFISAIRLITLDGEELELDSKGEAPEDCPGVHVVELEGVEDAVVGVVIEVDQTDLNSWSEIDAVELVGVPVAGTIASQWATAAEASSEYTPEGWNAMQATGAPNTPDCGDYTTAWASASSTEEATLIVYFDVPVIPIEVNIYQTYNPGAITSVEMLTVDGESYEFEIDPDEAATECPGILSVEFDESDVLVDAIAIYLDQSLTGSWNEIDAVELVGTVPGETLDLSETLEFEGFSINYPDSWVTTIDEGDVPVLATSDEALDRRDELNEEDVLINVLLPNVMEEQLDLDPTDDIDAILDNLIANAAMEGEVEEYDLLDNPAVIARVTGEGIVNDSTIIIVEYEGGNVAYTIESGAPFEAFEPLIVGILNTATYEG